MTAWRLYVCGDAAQYPPLRCLKTKHIPRYGEDEGKSERRLRSENLRRRLEEFNNLFLPVEQAVKAANAWVDNPSPEQLTHMFNIGKSAIDIGAVTAKGRKRRVDQLLWRTHHKEYKKKLKVAQIPAPMEE